MSEAFDGVYTMHEIARVHAAVLCGEYEEIAVTIERIAQSGLRTACLSNTNDEHWQTLLEFRAVKALHHRHASHLWGLAKPESSIYHRFEREVGCTGFDILFFDDLPENVASAIACGWDARLIDHTGNTAQQVCDALAERGVALQVASPRPA